MVTKRTCRGKKQQWCCKRIYAFDAEFLIHITMGHCKMVLKWALFMRLNLAMDLLNVDLDGIKNIYKLFMHLYKTTKGILLRHQQKSFQMNDEWDTIVNRNNLYEYLSALADDVKVGEEVNSNEWINKNLLAPIGTQEVWAAGVTYLKSRDARMEESVDTGAADCYSRVYDAERPELFFKALPHRVSGHNGHVHIRKDSVWNVPEPELTLYINSSGSIQGYTIGNDMSSRSIEGENPLYLPQAKVYNNSASIGPCLYIPEKPIDPETKIYMTIHRNGEKMFDDFTAISRMKRSLNELAKFLFREMDFENGCYLMTGTCVVPPNNFTLQKDDIVNISIDSIGTLTNYVTVKA
jgi:2-dehydro-3-deoxy-D-arabinonate dehydratase